MKSSMFDMGIITIIVALFVVVLLINFQLYRNLFQLKNQIKRQKLELDLMHKNIESILQENELQRKLLSQRVSEQNLMDSAEDLNENTINYQELQVQPLTLLWEQLLAPHMGHAYPCLSSLSHPHLC